MSDIIKTLLLNNASEINKRIRILNYHLDKIDSELETETDEEMIIKLEEDRQDVLDTLSKLRYGNIEKNKSEFLKGFVAAYKSSAQKIFSNWSK